MKDPIDPPGLKGGPGRQAKLAREFISKALLFVSIPDDWDKSGNITAESNPSEEFSRWQQFARNNPDLWDGDEFTLEDFEKYILLLQMQKGVSSTLATHPVTFQCRRADGAIGGIVVLPVEAACHFWRGVGVGTLFPGQLVTVSKEVWNQALALSEQIRERADKAEVQP